MHFLKCNHCGEYTDVKSEYVTFCQHCDKKLDNHFRQWSERNPNKSFADYKSLVCQTESEIKNQTPVKKPKSRKGLKYWIGFVFVALISSLLSQFYSGNLDGLFVSSRSSEHLLEQTWVKQTYGINGITIEAPFVLDSVDIPIPEDISNLIDYISSHIKETESGIVVMANTIIYSPKIDEFSLEGAAFGAIDEMKKQPGVSELSYKDEPSRMDGIPGIIQSGSYKLNRQKMKFVNFIYGKGLHLYQVSLVHVQKDKAGEEVVKRISESIKFEPIASDN